VIGGGALWLALVTWLACPAPARAALQDWKGHLALGYAKLLASDAPAGGFSVAVGVDYPVTRQLRLGPEVAYHLLGTRSLTSGSLNANLDHSLIELALLGHYAITRAGPLRRASFGPALMNASAQVSSSSAGLAFESYEVHGWCPGLALDLTLLPARPQKVAVGFEVGAHVAFATPDTWTVLSLRLVLHY
jgi:hypothetical protein